MAFGSIQTRRAKRVRSMGPRRSWYLGVFTCKALEVADKCSPIASVNSEFSNGLCCFYSTRIEISLEPNLASSIFNFAFAEIHVNVDFHARTSLAPSHKHKEFGESVHVSETGAE